MKKKDVPQFDELMNPTLQALKQLGGSASIDELVPEIIPLLGLPQEITEIPHGSGSCTELEYRSAWAWTYLRKAGLLENSERAEGPDQAQWPRGAGSGVATSLTVQGRTYRANDEPSHKLPLALAACLARIKEDARIAFSLHHKVVILKCLLDQRLFVRHVKCRDARHQVSKFRHLVP